MRLRSAKVLILLKLSILPHNIFHIFEYQETGYYFICIIRIILNSVLFPTHFYNIGISDSDSPLCLCENEFLRKLNCLLFGCCTNKWKKLMNELIKICATTPSEYYYFPPIPRIIDFACYQSLKNSNVVNKKIWNQNNK